MAVFPIVIGAQGLHSPAFEVASVKAKVFSESGVVSRHLRYDAQGLEAINYSVRLLIAEAYQLPVDFVTATDSTANNVLDRIYQVIAKAEKPAPKENIRMMLQTLLAERFKLTLHHESELRPVYRLVVRKQGARLEKSTAEVQNPHWVREPGGLIFRDATVARFCTLLSTFMGRPVLDSTGINGLYNFPYLEGASASEAGQSAILTAIQQLGLQLVTDKAALDYIVIDYVEQATAN